MVRRERETREQGRRTRGGKGEYRVGRGKEDRMEEHVHTRERENKGKGRKRVKKGETHRRGNGRTRRKESRKHGFCCELSYC